MWLDKRWGTKGVMLLVGLFAGLACGGYVAYRMIVRALGEGEGKEDEEGD